MKLIPADGQSNPSTRVYKGRLHDKRPSGRKAQIQTEVSMSRKPSVIGTQASQVLNRERQRSFPQALPKPLNTPLAEDLL